MKFTGGCINKALMAIFCIILGFVLCLASIGLVGYIGITKQGMVGTVANKVGDTIPLDFSDETKAMSLMDWGKDLFASLKNINTGTIGDIEQLAGVSVISKTVEKLLGVPADIIKTSSVENLAATISSNLTMQNAKTKFGIEFPDMPIFNDEAFLSSPLSTALSSFNDYTLNQVIEITEDGDAILQKLGNVKITELGGATTDNIIKSTTLGKLMTITDSSSAILKALKYCSIESQYTTNELNEQVYKTDTITELDDLGEPVEIEIELIGINEKINLLTMGEVITITETSNVILRKMRVATQEEIDAGDGGLFGTEDLLLTNLGGAQLTNIINGTTLGELVTIDETSEPIIQALKDTSIEGINGRVATLMLNELFSETQLTGGALNLIPPTTLLANIPTAMTEAMQNSTVATLKQKQILSPETFTNVGSMKIEQRAFVYNSDMGGLLGGMIDFVSDPIDVSDPMLPVINYSYVAPAQVDITATSFDSITAFVTEYTQYSSISFSDNVTIKVNEALDADLLSIDYDCYIIPLFNIKTDNITISFVDSALNTVDVKFAVFDIGTNASRNQCGYYYSRTNSTKILAVETTIEFDLQT